MSFKIIENDTIRKLWYGFLFASIATVSIFSLFATIHERGGQTPHKLRYVLPVLQVIRRRRAWCVSPTCRQVSRAAGAEDRRPWRKWSAEVSSSSWTDRRRSASVRVSWRRTRPRRCRSRTRHASSTPSSHTPATDAVCLIRNTRTFFPGHSSRTFPLSRTFYIV